MTTRQILPGGRWFDPEKAERWEETTTWNGNNHISNATGSQWDHERLFRTPSGRWIVHGSSNWQGTGDTWEIVEARDAAEWLIRNGYEKLPEELVAVASELEV